MSSLLILPFHLKESKKISFTNEDILEELIDITSTFSSIHVSSKSTSKYLFNNPVPFNQLKKTFNIDFLIEGGIKMVNGEFVISSRLINTENDTTLFKWKYYFNSNELSSILQSIASKTHQLTTANINDIEEDKNKAQEHYLTGLKHWKRYTHEELKTAIRHFKNSIKYNNNFSLSYAAIADCYCVIGVMGFENPTKSFITAKSFIQKAFNLNNKRSETFVSAALINMFLDRDYNQANTNLTQALLLNKNNLKVHHAYAMYYIHLNNFLSAEKHALINIKNAPLETPHYHIIAQIYL